MSTKSTKSFVKITKRCGWLVFALLITAGNAYCAPHSRPAELDSLAAQFKANANTNRVAEGKKIAALMPTCPIVYGNKWHWLGLGFGENKSFDWNHPSYKLSKSDLLQALGPPDHTSSFHIESWFYASYKLGRDKKSNEMALYLRCYNDYVVSGFVMPTNTVESISRHSYPDGSVTVKTNYIQ